MKKIVRLVFWLSLMLLMIPLLGCSTATCSEKKLPSFSQGRPGDGRRVSSPVGRR